MRKLISGFLILCASAMFAQETLDTKWVALFAWSQDLNQKALDWNEGCKADPSSDGCRFIRSVLNEQFNFFIACANRYSITGTDCRAVLRGHIIKHEIQVFTWNMECAGQKLTEKAAEACKGIAVAINDDQDQINKGTKQCEDEKL